MYPHSFIFVISNELWPYTDVCECALVNIIPVECDFVCNIITDTLWFWNKIGQISCRLAYDASCHNLGYCDAHGWYNTHIFTTWVGLPRAIQVAFLSKLEPRLIPRAAQVAFLSKFEPQNHSWYRGLPCLDIAAMAPCIISIMYFRCLFWILDVGTVLIFDSVCT